MLGQHLGQYLAESNRPYTSLRLRLHEFTLPEASLNSNSACLKINTRPFQSEQLPKTSASQCYTDKKRSVDFLNSTNDLL